MAIQTIAGSTGIILPKDTVAESTSVILSKDSRESPIPIVYFDRITLDTLDMMSTARAIRTARRGFTVSKSDLPPRPPDPRQGPSDLAINLKMHLELPLNQASLTTDNKILKHLNVIIMRSEDGRISKAVEISGDLLIKKFINQPGYTKIYQGLLSSLNPRKIIIGAAEEATDKKTLEVSFQLDDYPPNAKEHLSYYAMCYVEMKQDLIKQRPDNPGTPGQASLGTGTPSTRGVSPSPLPGWRRPGPQIPGPVSGENVFTAGRLNVTSYVYVVTSPFPAKLAGTYWAGPVFQDKNGKWSSALWTISMGRPQLKSTKPPMDLDRITVRNSKIQDFRIVKQIPSLKINLRPDKFFPLTIKGKDTYDNSIKNPDAYISNAFLSRDMHNNCRFMFEFDYVKFISRESKFGKILTNPFVPKSTKEKIYLYSRINSLQITRRQIEARRGYNRLGSPILGIYRTDWPSEIKTIVESASNEENNNLLQSIRSFAPGKSIGTIPNDQVGSIMELPRATLKFSPEETRTFMVTDNSVTVLSNGTYQYGVKIEVEDGSVRFLNERLKRLQTIRNYLVGYLNLVQIPKKSYQTISSKTEYYNRLFAKDPRRDTRAVLESAEINNLLTEKGRPVGNLTSKDILYPWIVAPEYFVDTLESISDFSSIIKPNHGSADLSRIRQTAEAMLTASNFTASNVGAFKKNLASRIANRRSSQNKGASQAGDPFNERATRFALQSLLDPFTATPVSITEVIKLFDFLSQKIKEMMGTSAQLDEPPDSIKRLGVSKNSKVSVLNLEDTFIELFDVQLSKFPAVDYIGFAGSPGLFPAVPGPNSFQTVVQHGASVNELAEGAINSQEPLDAGLNGVTVEDFQLRIEDEEEMSLDTDDEQETSTENSTTEQQGKKSQDGSQKREKLKEHLKEKKRKSEGEPGGVIKKTGGVFLTPSVIDSKNGLVIERSSIYSGTHEPEQYTSMENRAVAAFTGDAPSGPRVLVQDDVNHIMTKLNISVVPQGTPMSVQIDLNKGQGKDTHIISVDKVLGQEGSTVFKTNMVTQGTPSDGDDPMLLEIHRNQEYVRAIAQQFINTVAHTGVVDRVNGKSNGNPERIKEFYQDRDSLSVREKLIAIAKKIKKDPESVPDRVKDYMNSLRKRYLDSERSMDVSPMYRLSMGMLVKVTIFKGYELDGDGRFMIKKPIFEEPKSWSTVFSNLQNKKTSSEVVLCRIEKEFDEELGIGTSAGLNLVDTNVYFLITKNMASLALRKTNNTSTRPTGQNPPPRPVPPEAQSSIAISTGTLTTRK
jgi:hypothetical protein